MTIFSVPDEMARQDRIGLVIAQGIIGLIPSAILIYAIVGMIVQAIDYRSIRNWSVVPCSVIKTGYTQPYTDRGLPPRLLSVRYAYEWERQRLESSAWGYGSWALLSKKDGWEEPQAALARFLEERGRRSHECYVDPKNPRDAIFDRTHSPNSDWWVLLLASPLLLFLGIGVAFVRNALRLYRDGSTAETTKASP